MCAVLLCRWPATAVTWYSPGRTSLLVPVQPGTEVLRSQETRRITAGLRPVSTTVRDPPAPAQSAELQMRWPPAVITTAVDALTRNRHGCPPAPARTVKRGVAPGWYQYCGDERLSVTPPGAQASTAPAGRGGAGLRCRDRTGEGCGEAAGRGRLLCRCVWAEPAAVVLPTSAAWAGEWLASSPFTPQPRAVSSPMPTASTTTRRRQYVARVGLDGKERAPRGRPGRPCGF